MFRCFVLTVLASVLLGNASPAREHYIWFPATPDANPRPWAVLLPRAAGIGTLARGNQYWDLVSSLNERGIDALIIDYDAATAKVAAARGKTGPKIAAIVLDALADSRERSRMDARCPGVVIGWSRGAEGALTLASTEQGPIAGVKAAVVYYPSVRGQEQPWHQRIPVLALQGTGDQIAPAGSLLKLVASRQAKDVAFDVHLYDGAHHRFDVAHPVDNPTGKAPGDYDEKASTEALATIDTFLEMQGIKTGGCALD